MSFLRSNSAVPPQSAAVAPSYTGLQLQSATQVLPVPLLWGMTRASTNIIYYSNFQSHPQYSISAAPRGGKGGVIGGGGGGGTTLQVTGYTYSADLILALCEGPISGIGQVWSGQAIYNFADWSSGQSASGAFPWSTLGLPSNNLGTVLFLGDAAQSVWGYMSASHPAEALAYSGVAYLGGASFDLGSSASIGALAFEVKGKRFGTGINGADADPALVVHDFLLDPQCGVGFPGISIDASTLFGAGNDASLQTYCRAMGLAFSPFLNQAEAASGVLQRWAQLLNFGIVWSGDRMRFVPYGDTEIIGNGFTFVPNITPIYALDDDAFIYASNADPLSVQRVDPYTLPTVLRVEALNRSGVITGQGQPEYQATPVEARDQAMIETFGLRVASSVTAHEICDIDVAQTVAQTLLQRQLYVRRRFTFKLPAMYCLLDPMDVVSITDAGVAISNVLIRIVDISEDESDDLTFTAEELVIGVSTPAFNPTAAPGGVTVNAAAPAAAINIDPLLFEPPPSLSGGVNQIWFGASGGTAGVADPNWGGAVVWVSTDGANYQQLTTITAPATQGKLTTTLAQATGWDITNTATVDFSESDRPITSTSDVSAQTGQSLCLIDGELLAFAVATPISAHSYTISRLQRGLNQSCARTHSIGASFYVLDGALAKFAYPSSYIGVPLSIKFQSFNTRGGGVQDISTCSVYSFTPSGNGAPTAVMQGLQLGQSEDWGQTDYSVAAVENWGTTDDCPYGRTVDLGTTS